MRYKLPIILFVLGCSTDLAPDKLFKYDICLDEVNVAVTGFFLDCFEMLCMVLCCFVNQLLLPTIDFTSRSLFNVQYYFRHNVHIWFLFNRLTFVYKHTDYCVRSFYSFTRTFFVRGALAAASVLVVLMFASSMNTGVLVGYGEFVYG